MKLLRKIILIIMHCHNVGFLGVSDILIKQICNHSKTNIIYREKNNTVSLCTVCGTQ